MTPKTPAEAIERFSERLSAGDLDGALVLYEPTATFVVGPGRIVQGHEAIREALEGFLALRPRMEGEIQKVVQTDDVALVVNAWRLEGRDPSRQAIEMSGRSADVVRRGADGTWRVLIDDPWGAN